MKNVIYIDNISLPDIKKILEQWVGLYSEQLNDHFEFSLISSETGYVIKGPKELNNTLFTFLVNYITYPENFNERFYPTGYMIVTDTKYYPEDIINKKIMTYVPANDKEYDLVYANTEDKRTFVIDFGGKVSEIKNTSTYNDPKPFKVIAEEVISVNVIKENIRTAKANDNSIIKFFRKIFA